MAGSKRNQKMGLRKMFASPIGFARACAEIAPFSFSLSCSCACPFSEPSHHNPPTFLPLPLCSQDGRQLNIPVNDVITPTYVKRVPGEGMPLTKDPGTRGDLVRHLCVHKLHETAATRNPPVTTMPPSPLSALFILIMLVQRLATNPFSHASVASSPSLPFHVIWCRPLSLRLCSQLVSQTKTNASSVQPSRDVSLSPVLVFFLFFLVLGRLVFSFPLPLFTTSALLCPLAPPPPLW